MTNPVVIGPGGVHHVAGELLEAEQQHCGSEGGEPSHQDHQPLPRPSSLQNQVEHLS